MSCPICLEDIESTSILFRRPCHHLAHFSCVRQSLPANCPVCRRAWDDDCERERTVCVNKAQLLWKSMLSGAVAKKRKFNPYIVIGPPQHAGSMSVQGAIRPTDRPTVPPDDFVPLCCRHLGETQRAMHYNPEWCRVDNAWKTCGFVTVAQTPLAAICSSNSCWRHVRGHCSGNSATTTVPSHR